MASLLICQSILATGTRRGQICGRVCHNNQQACHYHRAGLPARVIAETPVRSNYREYSPPAPAPEPEYRIPSFQSFLDFQGPIQERNLSLTERNLSLRLAYESPQSSLNVEDRLVNKLLDAKGCSSMSVGECPICFNEESSLISYPCHETHVICISCLTENVKAKCNRIICPHCRKEVENESKTFHLPLPNRNALFHHIHTSRDNTLRAFVPIIPGYIDSFRRRVMDHVLLLLRSSFPDFNIEFFDDSEINPQFNHRVHIDIPVRSGYTTFSEPHLLDRRKALRVVLDAMEQMGY